MLAESLENSARHAFTSTFGAKPALQAKAPARVELLGNHTDYNGGLVLAAAIDRYTVVVGDRQGAASTAEFRSLNFDDSIERVDLAGIKPGEEGSWGRYVRGVLWALREAYGDLGGGFRGAIAGNVPLGAGISSSASLQASLAVWILNLLEQESLPIPRDDAERMTLVKTLQRSENAFVGVASGLLDQFAVVFGREGHALRLDCRSLEFERLPMGESPPEILICDTKTSRRLADGMYNLRRGECERVVSAFQKRKGIEAVGWLRDVSLEELEAEWNHLDPVGRLRARHVLTENRRVERGADALKRGNLGEFGRLMSESHASSRDDFGNSSPALDAMIEAAETSPGFLGGKLSGAGWAGCVVALVERGKGNDFAEDARTRYARATGVIPEIHVCRAAEGARVEPFQA